MMLRRCVCVCVLGGGLLACVCVVCALCLLLQAAVSVALVRWYSYRPL